MTYTIGKYRFELWEESVALIEDIQRPEWQLHHLSEDDILDMHHGLSKALRKIRAEKQRLIEQRKRENRR